jgi:hypothetical protein
MDRIHLRRAVALGFLVALPAAAQDNPAIVRPPSSPMVLVPGGGLVPAPVTEDAPATARPGLFGWRRRHAERKRHLQEKVLGYPEEFNEWPLGQALYGLGRTQVANGAAARMIFNHYDFVGDTDELNTRGRDKLGAVISLLPSSFAPVIVERTPWAPSVAESRRLAILGKLADGQFPVPAERVVVGPAVAEGLSGREAVLVNQSRQTLFYGDGGGVPNGGMDASGLLGGASDLGAAGIAPR